VGAWGRRVARIKLVPFIEAVEKALPEIDIPEQVPGFMLCPVHSERSGSFLLQLHRWHCFGCGRGGDVVDLVAAYHEIEFKSAVLMVEVALGFNEAGEDQELAALVTLARNSAVGEVIPTVKEWEALIGIVEESFFESLRPYLRSADLLVADHAWRIADFVFAELKDSAYPVPKTGRGMRENLRRLREWSLGWASGVERDVLRMTGKDRLDAGLHPLHPVCGTAKS